MKCKDIQDYILTDYMDGLLPQDRKELIDSHIEQCLECQNFLVAVQKSAVDPFLAAQKVDISENKVWESIREKIDFDQREDVAGDVFQSVLEKMKGFILVRKPVFAFATCAMVGFLMILFKFLPFVTQPLSGNSGNSFEYYVSLNETWEEIDVDFGTDVEEFLL